MSEHHIVPPKHYFINFACLTVLMILTVLAAEYVDIGNLGNLALALAIAIAKASLIVIIFMDVRNSSKLTWLFAGVGFFWFMIMITFTLVDMFPGVHESMGSPYTDPIPISAQLPAETPAP